MSDHIDGPRQIGDPAADVTDLFAFISPENPKNTVVALNVFPSAGVSALFSNAVNHSIVIRRMNVTGRGHKVKFQPEDPEIRFSCRFDVLQHGPDGGTPIQRGTLTCPDRQELTFVVNDEKGATSPDGVCRVFAGLRSDPFLLAWIGSKPFANLLQHDNVLAIVIEFDTERVLAPGKGPLFGIIGETSPLAKSINPVEHPPARFDWVGRPEQTNQRLNNGGLGSVDDLRDLWNQQTPFTVAKEFEPVFRQRLLDSLTDWDMRDGKKDWSREELDAVVDVYLDDFLLLDVSKPTTDTSFLEIEKSVLHDTPYQTGGGRTIDANVIDILMTWMVNKDREALHGGAKQPTKLALKTFPYEAPPNAELQTVQDGADLAAPPDPVWSVVGQFGGMWHPLIAKIQLIGEGVGQLRIIETVDGKQIIERLEAINNSQRSYRYRNISGLGVVEYTGTFEVTTKGNGCSAAWRVQYLADNQPDFLVRVIVSTLMKTGFEALRKRFGAAQ